MANSVYTKKTLAMSMSGVYNILIVYQCRGPPSIVSYTEFKTYKSKQYCSTLKPRWTFNDRYTEKEKHKMILYPLTYLTKSLSVGANNLGVFNQFLKI